MIKPVMPSLSDGISHLLNYKEHKATVHKENGKFHVHYEYIEAAKKSADESTPHNNNVKKSDSPNEHTMFTLLSDVVAPDISQDHLNTVIQYLPVISLPDDFRPPILLASIT